MSSEKILQLKKWLKAKRNGLFFRVRNLLGIKQSTQNYWDQRADNLGERSVINIKLNAPIEEITAKQEKEIFPFLKRSLNGDERTLLDFGCGSGRFTKKLAEFTGARAIGADTTRALVNLARKSITDIEFELIKNNKLPFLNKSFDIVWICLVIGGVPEKELKSVLLEINRVLKDNGLVFLIENTSRIPDAKHWSYHNPQYFIDIFDFADVKVLGKYVEADEEITIFGGRKLARP